jgi:hypothetical protein
MSWSSVGPVGIGTRTIVPLGAILTWRAARTSSISSLKSKILLAAYSDRRSVSDVIRALFASRL